MVTDRKLYDLCAAEPERRFSPFCWRAKLALVHKGIDFETVPMAFTEKDKIEFSGQDKVPVLTDGDGTIADSWAIAEHLETTYPERPSLFGSGRSLALFLKHWTEQSVLFPVLRTVILDVYHHLAPADQAYFRANREARFGKPLEEVAISEAQGAAALTSVLAPLRMMLADRAFIAGDAPDHADHVAVAPFLWARAISRRKLLASDDPLAAWRDRVLDAYGGYARAAPGYDE